MDINTIIARRVRELRDAQGLTLAALAQRSTVSRSNISLIERGESSATATVLDKLSAALGVTVSALFEPPPHSSPSPLSRRADQPAWTDPGSGYVRHKLTPAGCLPIQLVEVHFPAGARVAYDTAARSVDVHQQVWVVEGSMELTVGATLWRLDQNDCLAMQLDQPIAFHNPTDKPARYLVALISPAHLPPRSAQ